MTPEEIQSRGWQALLKELGPLNASRFVVQNNLGAGDFTAERDELMKDETLASVLARIRENREARA